MPDDEPFRLSDTCPKDGWVQLYGGKTQISLQYVDLSQLLSALHLGVTGQLFDSMFYYALTKAIANTTAGSATNVGLL